MRKRQFLVLGVGRFGTALATALHEQGHQVVAVDRSEERVERIMERVTHALIADATDEHVLRDLGVANFDAVIVAIGANFEANVLATVTAKSLGAQHVVSKASSEVAANVLTRVGADLVVRPEHDMGLRLAQHLTTPELLDAFSLGEGHAVIEVEANRKLQGSLAHLRLPNRFQVQVIAINRGGALTLSPSADFVLQRGDRLVVIGSNAAIDRFRDHLSD